MASARIPPSHGDDSAFFPAVFTRVCAQVLGKLNHAVGFIVRCVNIEAQRTEFLLHLDDSWLGKVQVRIGIDAPLNALAKVANQKIPPIATLKAPAHSGFGLVSMPVFEQQRKFFY
jgi:hypothetical protein